MKRDAPATGRNSAPIAAVLERELPSTGLVLEIASGTGQHAVFFARSFPSLDWQPSDLDPSACASIDAYALEAGLANLKPAIRFDASDADKPVDSADAILCINMVHISPWSATVGLFDHAAQMLEPGAPLILYGPYLEQDVETAPTNLAFDRSLRTCDPAWGLRDAEALDTLAGKVGFSRTARHAMPSNNIMLIFLRTVGD